MISGHLLYLGGTMNRRLQQIYDLLPKDGIGIVDVGTDHGLIPTRLALDHYRGNIIASDVVPGPLNTAKKYAKENRVENRIQFLLCDGLEKCPPEQIDTVVIAGMGGDTICGILDRGEWLFKRSYRLILQPMTRADRLRESLASSGFAISDEAYGIASARPYVCIVASYAGKVENPTPAVLEIGTPAVRRNPDSPAFAAYVRRRIKAREKERSGCLAKGDEEGAQALGELIRELKNACPAQNEKRNGEGI